jgi:hypothetical protein
MGGRHALRSQAIRAPSDRLSRCSSDHQREASIEDQVRECRAFIERQGWVYPS